MQHLFVTGGAGFIGSNFTRYMLEKYADLQITVYDKLTYAGRIENLHDVEQRFAGRYRFAEGDICDATRVAEVLATHKIDTPKIDTVVNFAAETHVDRSIIDPNAFIQTDVFGTYVLLDAAHKAGNLRYHQISTDEVYGHIEEGHRSLETDNLAPRSPYAASKAGGDHLVNSYFITYGLPITISRGANNIGPYQYPEKALPLFATNALNDQTLPIYGDGQQRRDYQFVLDHCQAVDLILHQGVIGETYNIGTGTEMTNLEMVRILLDELGKPASLIRHVEDRMGHDRRYCLNVQKIMDLGWEPDFTHEEAIRATARWYADNRQWWEPIRNGEFKAYYQQLYGNRKVLERP